MWSPSLQPTGLTIRQIDESSSLWSEAKDVPVVMDNSGDSGVIPVSCSGTVSRDFVVVFLKIVSIEENVWFRHLRALTKTQINSLTSHYDTSQAIV